MWSVLMHILGLVFLGFFACCLSKLFSLCGKSKKQDGKVL